MLIAVCAVFGLLVGSFLNVVVSRVPAGESIASPPSRCPSCQTPIAPRDNIPVVSWLLLRGRARCCGTPISRRYPLVEAGTALVFGLVTAWVQHRTTASDPALWPLGDARLPDAAAVVALVGFLYIAAVGIALTLIDLDTFLLPYVIVFPSSVVVAVLLGGSALLAGEPSVALRMVLGGAALWLFYRLLHQVYAKGMGYGDVRLAAMVGGYLAWFGWDVLIVGAFLAFLVGGVFGAVMMAFQGAGLKTKIPYGPYMIAGSVLGLVFGHSIAQAYLHASGLA